MDKRVAQMDFAGLLLVDRKGQFMWIGAEMLELFRVGNSEKGGTDEINRRGIGGRNHNEREIGKELSFAPDTGTRAEKPAARCAGL